MTKYEKIMTMNIEEFAKWLKQFSKFNEDWQILRLWLESNAKDGM